MACLSFDTEWSPSSCFSTFVFAAELIFSAYLIMILGAMYLAGRYLEPSRKLHPGDFVWFNFFDAAVPFTAARFQTLCLELVSWVWEEDLLREQKFFFSMFTKRR